MKNTNLEDKTGGSRNMCEKLVAVILYSKMSRNFFLVPFGQHSKTIFDVLATHNRGI